ncbi:MAG: hypothetical protein HYV59_04160 [Planctomycetes bacterium]|nr:hypothetical protein [Planctomycetota bacterium]
MRKKIIWIERLDFLKVFVFAVYSFFPSYIIIHYNEHNVTRFGKLLFNFIKRFNLHKKFSPVDLSLEKRDSGCTLFYQLSNDFHACFEEFCKKYIFHESNRVKNMIESYAFNLLRDRITFITIAGFEAAQSNDKQKHIIYIMRYPLNTVIIPFYSKNGFILRESFGFIGSINYFLKPFYCIARLLLAKVNSPNVNSNISNIKPSIWVEYTPSAVTDFTFWREGIESKDFDIVYYFDRSDTPLTTETINSIEKKDLKWIDLNEKILFQLSTFGLKDFKRIILELFRGDSTLPFRFRQILFECELWYLLYKFVFSRFQVKLLIQHQDWFWKQEVQTRALEGSGGILVGLHWSNYHSVMTPWHLFPYHVFFLWGKLIHDFVLTGKNTCKYMLPSGIWITAGKHKPEQLNSLFESLSFVVTIFDSSSSYNGIVTPGSLSKFFLRILKLIENNPSWGAILKSKGKKRKNFLSLPSGEKIIEKLELLAKQNRAVVLENAVSPGTAAAYSDLSVCCGLNSAGIIAGIHAYRAVHWDCAGWLKHPFYKDPEQQFIFQTLEELEQAIIKASKGDTTIGDFSRWRQRFNYFDDLNAPKRVGRFIQTFMDTIIRTNNAGYSLDYSVKEYIKKNNIGDDFFRLEHC